MWTNTYIVPLALLLASCQNADPKASKAVPPSVDPPVQKSHVYSPSDLALEMRDIYAKLKIVGHELKNNEPVTDSLLLGYERVLEVSGIEPADTNQSFQAFAQLWLGRVGAFKAEKSEENYNAVMDGCVACHQERCPGPIPKIKRLKL